MPRFPAPFRLLLLSVSLFATSVISDAQPQISAHSLHSLLDDALEHFGRGDAAGAADRFAQIRRDFATEPELADPDFLRRLLPLQGNAEFAAGRPAAAAKTLARFVDDFPDDSQQPRALYTLALAFRQSQQPADALQRFSEFRNRHPNHPLLPLANLQEVQLLLAKNETDAAIKIAEQFSKNTSATAARDQARLQIIRHLTKTDPVRAAELLFAAGRDFETTPEIASLSMTALELGDRLQERSKSAQALRLYRIALPRDRLLNQLAERISELSALTESVAEDPFLRDYRIRLLNRLKQQENSLRNGGDFTDALLLRRAEALLAADRPHEAWLLLEQLALNESVPTEIRQQAHARWTIAASALEHWEEALTIARYFLSLYPESPLAPETLSLIAQAHQEQRRYDEAIEVLKTLRVQFPEHPLAQRWSFTLGFNQTARETYAEARAEFKRAAAIDPKNPLGARAELWHALTFFFERDYENALTEFDRLSETYSAHPLEGEIRYRRAATLYAMRDYERAEPAAAEFAENFKTHVRYGEALVLLGDIQMGAGALDEAVQTFESIPPEMDALRTYGLFQRGKILRAHQDYDAMIALFSDYISASHAADPKPRMSEALYWIGWAHQQQGEPEKAVPLFLQALDQFGDDPKSREIPAILDLLEPLHSHRNSDAGDFGSWLQVKRLEARDSKNLNYYARLTLQLSRIRERDGFPNRAEELLFEIAARTRPEALGPDVLGAVGHFLLTKNLQNAGDWFERLLTDFPEAPERATAFHGLGIRSYKEKNYETALKWFRRFQNETPAHELTAVVFQLAGQTLLALDRHEEATRQFEQILELRAFRGRPHAEALTGLAETWTAAGNPARAIAYYQRVYTMHRAQPDLVARAYAESSALFEQLGDLDAAHRTLVEMLAIEELAIFELTATARETEKTLAAKLETENPPATSDP